MTSRFETVAVPMQKLDDGREFISDQAVADMPELARFIGAFPNYFGREPILGGWVSPMPDASSIAPPPQRSNE